MTKRTIERDELVEETIEEEVILCDDCGQEATDPTRFYSSEAQLRIHFCEDCLDQPTFSVRKNDIDTMFTDNGAIALGLGISGALHAFFIGLSNGGFGEIFASLFLWAIITAVVLFPIGYIADRFYYNGDGA